MSRTSQSDEPVAASAQRGTRLKTLPTHLTSTSARRQAIHCKQNRRPFKLVDKIRRCLRLSSLVDRQGSANAQPSPKVSSTCASSAFTTTGPAVLLAVFLGLRACTGTYLTATATTPKQQVLRTPFALTSPRHWPGLFPRLSDLSLPLSLPSLPLFSSFILPVKSSAVFCHPLHAKTPAVAPAQFLLADLVGVPFSDKHGARSEKKNSASASSFLDPSTTLFCLRFLAWAHLPSSNKHQETVPLLPLHPPRQSASSRSRFKQVPSPAALVRARATLHHIHIPRPHPQPSAPTSTLLRIHIAKGPHHHLSPHASTHISGSFFALCAVVPDARPPQRSPGKIKKDSRPASPLLEPSPKHHTFETDLS